MLTGEQGEVEAEDPGMNGAQVEQANDISRFNVSTLKLEEETETVEEGLEAEVPEEASTVDCAGDLEGAKEEPGERDMSALLQIFEDEAEVD